VVLSAEDFQKRLINFFLSAGNRAARNTLLAPTAMRDAFGGERKSKSDPDAEHRKRQNKALALIRTAGEAARDAGGRTSTNQQR